jgi:tRNA (uracil-5-)-methyltransferase
MVNAMKLMVNESEKTSAANDESINATSADSLEHSKTCQDDSTTSKNDVPVPASTACQFKNVVAIVDPPHVSLHPTVSKFELFPEMRCCH